MNNTNKSVALVDVMNSKSEYICRHSVDIKNLSEIRKYYAIESRIYNGIWNNEENKYVKGSLWFTNYMIFDFDFDKEHFPELETDEDMKRKLDESLNSLFSILGTPKYIIRNKTNTGKDVYSDYQKKKYFTKNNITKLPKKHGCQVVYELDKSLQNIYKEQIVVYNLVRNIISAKCDGDLNFKGHMFKNFHNRYLFNVKTFKDVETNKINLYNLCKIYENEIVSSNKKYREIYKVNSKNNNNNSNNYNNNDSDNCIDNDYSLIDSIFSLKPFETIKNETILAPQFKRYSTKLVNEYINNINTYNHGSFGSGISSRNNSYSDKNSDNNNSSNGNNGDCIKDIVLNYSDYYINNFVNNGKEESLLKSKGRNETLFNYFNIIPLKILEIFDYNNDYICTLYNSTNIFDNCDIKDPLEIEEFETIKESVLNYRIENYLDEGYEIKTLNDNSNNSSSNNSNSGNDVGDVKKIDYRVFKIDQNKFNHNFVNENRNNIFNSSIVNASNNNCCKYNPNTQKYEYKYEHGSKYNNYSYGCDWGYKNVIDIKYVYGNLKIELYDINIIRDIININKKEVIIKNTAMMLANVFLHDPITILSNIPSLFNQHLINFINREILKESEIFLGGLYDYYRIVKDAIFYTHFKLKHSIKNAKLDNIERNKLTLEENRENIKLNGAKANRERRNKYLEETWGIINYIKNENDSNNGKLNNLKEIINFIEYFKPFYSKLEKENLIKENGKAKTVSFYQNYFNVRNCYASEYRRTINRYVNYIELINKIENIVKNIIKNKIKFKKYILENLYYSSSINNFKTETNYTEVGKGEQEYKLLMLIKMLLTKYISVYNYFLIDIKYIFNYSPG